MRDRRKASRTVVPQETSHIPKDSAFFEKVVPTLLAIMAIMTVVLILIAVGIISGLFSF